MSSGEEAAVAPFHGTFTKDILYELHRRQPHRFHFMTKFNAKSASWKDFELVVLDGELRDFARCVHCKNFVSYSSKKGTGSMLRHRCHAKESYFTAEEHNRFREMELFMRTTPQPLPMLGGLSSQFLPRIKVELPEPPESPLRRLNTDCGVGSLSNNCDDSPLDVRIHPRSPNGSANNGGRCARGSATVGGAPMVDNGEVEEIVASVELADDSTGGDVLEDRNNCTPTGAAAGAARMPYAAAARAVAERQLVELQRLHAEEEHKLKVELLKKQHMVADLQRKYWRMKVKALAQKASSAPSSYHACENKSVEEDESDSPD